MTDIRSGTLVLAVYPHTRGFAYVLFEGPDAPLDWAIKDLREKSRSSRTLQEIRKLIERYRPDVLAIEDSTSESSRRTSRIRKLYRMLAHFALSEYVELYQCPKADLKGYFEPLGASTKHEIATAIATQIPAFAHRMPRPRKPWTAEDRRQSLFDAAALGLAYYGRHIRSPYEGLLS